MSLFYFLLEKGFFSTYWMMVYCLTTFELLLATFCFCFRLKKKRHFWIIAPLEISVLFAISIGLGYLREIFPNSVVYRMCSTLLQYSFALLIIWTCFRENPQTKLLAWVASLSIREIADASHALSLLAAGVNPAYDFQYFPNVLPAQVNALLWDLFHFAIDFVLGFYFSRFRGEGRDRESVLHTIIISIVILISTVVLKTFILHYRGESKMMYVLASIQNIILGLITLILRTDMLQGSQAKQELATMNLVMNSQQRQYEATKENIAIVNAKVHDIKHALEQYGEKLALEDMNRIKDSIKIYDKQFHTGSDVLDTVLYQKSLACDSLGITLTAMADGTLLFFLHKSERYYLFCNILDNAIEACKDLPNPEERLIGLNIYAQGQYVHIESYNYFSGTRTLQDGMLATSKKDARNHGYGLRSIKMLVESYQGNIAITIDQNRFYLNIQFPLQKK